MLFYLFSAFYSHSHVFAFLQSGDIEIVNHRTRDTCQLKFSPYSYFSKDVPRKVTAGAESVCCCHLLEVVATWASEQGKSCGTLITLLESNTTAFLGFWTLMCKVQTER